MLRAMAGTDVHDPHNLRRFVEAQAPVYDRVRAELGRGRKSSHWIWFIFPQISGLGRSPMAETFAVKSLREAEAYLDHPILGPRLRECARLVNEVKGRSIGEILGDPDDLKFRSCMTLFARASAEDEVFTTALNKYFGGEPDRATLDRI
jgi:uncharacterized protein (DUF1810 family)